MKKLTEKEQKLKEALEIIGMERYSFSTKTYHKLQGRISVGRTYRFEFTGAFNKGQVTDKNYKFDNPLTNRSEWIDTVLLKSTGIKGIKTLFRAILKLENKTEKEYLDSYTRTYALAN